MKKIILLLFFLTLFTPQKILAVTDGSQIEYFGYYGGDDYIDNFASYANAIHLFITPGSTPEEAAERVIARLSKVINYNRKAIIHLDNIFFRPDADQDNYGILYGDYVSRWTQFWDLISPYKNNILAFFTADEPDNWIKRGDWWAITALVKNTAPDISQWQNISGPGADMWCSGDFNSNVGLPPQIDWISFDGYWCVGNTTCQPLIENRINCFNNLSLSTGRKFLLVPEAYFGGYPSTIPPEPEFSTLQNNLIQINEWYYNQCKIKSECLGIMPFIWDTNWELVGVNSMPILENYFKMELAPRIVNQSNSGSLVNVADLRQNISQFTNIFSYNNIVKSYGFVMSPQVVFPSTDLVSYWKMDDTDSNVTLSGTSLGPGVIGNSRLFNGTSDKVVISNEANFDFEYNQEFSVSAWIKTMADGVYQNIFTKADSSLSRGYTFRSEASNGIGLALFTSSGNKIWGYETQKLINDGLWHHVVATYNGHGAFSGIKLYVDGVSRTTIDGSTGTIGTLLNNIDPIIGAPRWTGSDDNFFNGRMDEVGIWSRALTPTEITTLYNNSQGLQP